MFLKIVWAEVGNTGKAMEMATCSKYVMLVLGATLSDLEGEREPKTSLWNQSQIRFAAVLERKCSLLQHLSRLQMMCLLGSEGAALSSAEQHHFGSPSRRSFRLFLITWTIFYAETRVPTAALLPPDGLDAIAVLPPTDFFKAVTFFTEL